MGVCRQRSSRRFGLHLALLLVLALAVGAPATAQAGKKGCMLVKEGFSEASCTYRAAGPGGYSAVLQTTRATIRINGIALIALSSSNQMQRGYVPSHRGDVVQVTIRRDCDPMICIKPPSAAYIQVQDR